MTWKEIKDKIESIGVKDDDEVSYIDISDDIMDVSEIYVENHNNKWEIAN